MPKYAFITMDVETFFDTSCVKQAGILPCAEDSCAEGIQKFIEMAKTYQIRTTLFVTTDSLTYTLPYLKEAKAQGHYLALHAEEHVSPVALPVAQFERQLQQSLQCMQNTFGVAPKGYRAPCFGLDDEREKIVEKYFSYDSSNLGYKKALRSSTFSLKDFQKYDNVVYRKENFWEFRPCVGKLLGSKFPLSGGAYVRMVPWVFLKHSLKQYLRTHNSYLFYVHPFELCNQAIQSTKKLRFFDRMYVRIGRKNYDKKIEKIIRFLKQEGYEFITPEEYIEVGI